jgi:threonine aldolase
MKPIDLRSDTVTRPSAAMRAAMAAAEVGDDVYGEDPTVNALQAEAARLAGKEAALFVPSGTMANQAALRAQTQHGDLVLASEGAHLVRYESGAAAAISGVQVKTLGAAGLFDADDVRRAVTTPDHHNPPTTLVALENTHNAAGGRIVPFELVRAVAHAARALGLGLHLDGARVFNAAAATGVPVAAWAEAFDTVTFCLSKGLGAPAGSMVCGTAATIERVHRVRKMLGGGMRQAGVLAAAGLHALEHNVARLADDHANATRLARGLAELGLEVDPWPETNIVFFGAPRGGRGAGNFSVALRTRGVLANAVGEDRLRAVTHLDVGADDVAEALARVRATLG